MTHDPDRLPDAPDDLGPDLLALVRGELDGDRARDLEARLASSPELQAEHARLAADHAAWAEALAGDAPEPRREILDELLATVADEAAERRARLAVALSPVSEDLGADVVALALGQLHGHERTRVEARVANESRLAAEADVVRRLATATRAALALEPRPETLPALLARIAERGPAPVIFDTQDVPAPRDARSGRLRLLGWLAPLAAAAVLLVALQPPPPGAARISEGTAFVGQRTEGTGGTYDGEWVDSADGAFDFAYGDVIGAGTSPLTIRVACGEDGDAPTAAGPLAAGDAEFVLEPGTRLARVDAAHFDLLEGRVRITAKHLVERLEVRSGSLFARVAGTEFDVAAFDGRLFVTVDAGKVRLGRRGPSGEAESVVLGPGEQGMADDRRVVSARLDGRTNGDAFLTPRAALKGPSRALASGAPLELTATLSVGEGGPVTIAGFDASVPLFLVRLKGPEGRAHEIKVQESMLQEPAPVDRGDDAPPAGLWRLTGDRPYELRLAIPDLVLEPGRWEARLRYMSYRVRESAAPWLGAVESEPVSFEVSPR
jgi:anti-sigma factor RsiW